MDKLLDKRPLIVAVAGPDGAGKSTFFEAFLEPLGLPFIDADAIARELKLDAYTAAEAAAGIRDELISRGESFVFETVLSDPHGEKVARLRQAACNGYTVVLCFIGLDSPETSDERVAMRVTQGGHDVPVEKLKGRYPRTLANLARAIRDLPFVFVFDNSDLADSFRLIAQYRDGQRERSAGLQPGWFGKIAEGGRA